MNSTNNDGSYIDSEKLKTEIEYIKKHEDYLVQQSIIQNAIDKARRIAYLFDLKYGKTVIPAIYNIDTGLIDLI